MYVKRRISANKQVYLDVPGIPPKINEIIGYLSTEFSKASYKSTTNLILERDDIAQDLYLLYFSILKKHPKYKNFKPGFFFIKFKWFLLTKWRKRVNLINKEWEYKRVKLGELNCKAQEIEPKAVTSKPKHKPYKKYNF
jgi:hypothetical protein